MAAARQIVEAIELRVRDRPVLVAIDGRGGSGKSTLAAAVAELSGAVVVHGDDFYRPMDAYERERLGPAEGMLRYFDWQRLRDQVLVPLAAGGAAAYDQFDWGSGQLTSAPPVRIDSPGTVIIEGVYSARLELADFYDLVVFVDTPPEVSFERIRARGHDHGSIDWELRWRLAEEHYLAESALRDRADLIVQG
jgi:uridine kinase